MRRKSRFLAAVLVIGLVVTSIVPAAAVTQRLTLQPMSGYDSYHFTWSEILYKSGITRLTVDGETAFCTQAFRAIRDYDGNQYKAGTKDTITTSYAVREITKDNSLQSRIAYLGYYSLERPTDKDYAFTQMYIWQSLPAEDKTSNGKDEKGEYRSYFADRDLRAEYESWKNSIGKELELWSVRPVFDGKSISIAAGEKKKIADSRGVLEDYDSFAFAKDGIKVSHVRGSNELSVEAAKACSSRTVTMSGEELTASGAQKYGGNIKANYVYNADNSQDMAVYGGIGSSEGLSLSFDVDIIKGKIAIVKTKAPDSADENIAYEQGAEFEVYPASAGSYSEADSQLRDIIITDGSGKAVTCELPHGIYTVHQTKGAEGHIFAEDFQVVIGTEEDGRIYEYRINNETLQSRLKLVKKDVESGKIIPISGTAYELINLTTGETVNGPSEEGYFITDHSGSFVTPEPLFYGDYEIIERRAPDGYVLDETPIRFTVSGTEPVIEIEQRDAPQKGVIRLYKTGQRFYTVKEKDGAYTPVYSDTVLEGAVFEIRAAEDIITPDGTVRVKKGAPVETLTTDERGMAETEPMYLGRYEVREVRAPENHVASREVYQVELKYGGQDVKITSEELNVDNERQNAKIFFEKINCDFRKPLI